MKTVRVTSLVLAALLQLLPLCRNALVAITAETPHIAIIFRWLAGAAAVWGGVDAVSGASTVITSARTATATNGVPFTYRITAGPEVPNTFNASPLPSSLTVNTTSGRITGTPGTTGVFLITLLASADNRPDRTVTATLALTIVPAVTLTSPNITSPPTNLTVTAGNSATFHVTATGSAPLSYQWRFNGATIAGAMAASYTLTNCQAGNAGTYSVVASNTAGSATSTGATLTVNPAPVAPGIATPAAGQTVTAGNSATFTVIATGTAPLFYQWRFNGGNLTGATSAALTLNNCQTNNAGTYSVVVSNTAGTVTSTGATLTVNPALVAPGIATPPANQSVIMGGTATFTVTATGTAPLFYQWRFNGGNLTGATSAALTRNNCQTNNAGAYSVVVSNATGTATSSAATLTVTPSAIAPTIATTPTNLTVNAGSLASFTVAANGTAPFSYQWRRNGVNIPGATSATWTLSTAQPTDAGTYSVVVSNAAGSVTSGSATLTVNAAVAPAIATPPASQTITAGSPATFTVTATGTAPLFYQWRFNGGNFAGATSATLTLNNCQTNNAGTYSVVVSNAAGTATSAGAALTVQLPTAPLTLSVTGLGAVTPNLHGQELIIGANYTLTANPSAGHTFQGWSGGRNSTNSSLTFIMESGLSLIATFQPMPTNDVTGAYAGLFYESTGARYETAGLLQMRSIRGRSRGSLRIGGSRFAVTTTLDATGHATTSAKCRGQIPLTLDLQANLTNGAATVTGSVGDGIWLADALCDRAVISRPSPFAGTYHIPVPDLSGTPSNSWAIATVKPNGQIRLKGKLPLGGAVRQTAAVSPAGTWPLYVPFRDGTALIGWITLRDPTTGTVDADVQWLQRSTTVP